MEELTLHHDGQILEKEIRVFGNITKLSREMGVNRKTFYNWYLKPRLPESVAIRVGEAIEVDLLAKYPGQFTGDTPFQSARSAAENNVDAAFWREKYYASLESTVAILKENSDLKSEILELKSKKLSPGGNN